MKRIATILMLIFGLFLIGCGAGLDGVNDDYKFDSLNAQIAGLNTQIADLQTKLDGLAGTPGPAGEPGPAGTPGISPEEIAAINEQITLLQTEVTDLTNELNELRTQVGTIDERLTVLEGECEDVKDALTLLDDRVSALEDAVAALATRGENGAAYIFSGTGNPGEGSFEDVRDGDFYIDLLLNDHNGQKGHKVWVYFAGEWRYFGQIFKTTGSAAPVFEY